MKRIAIIFVMAIAISCGRDSNRTADDQTDQNVSPNQTVPAEEEQVKDSTIEAVGEHEADSVSDNNDQPNN
jgi:hypothetical protein